MTTTKKTAWDENFVYRSDKNLPDFLRIRGVQEIEIVFRSKGWEIIGDCPEDYEGEEVRSLVEANAYLANGDYLELSEDEQKAVWELYAEEVNAEPLGP